MSNGETHFEVKDRKSTDEFCINVNFTDRSMHETVTCLG